MSSIAVTTKSVTLSGKRIVHWIGSDVRLTVAVVILTCMVFCAIWGPRLAPYNPELPDQAVRLSAPSRHHLFGADVNGFDVFSRVISAPRLDLLIPAVSVSVSLAVGSFLGLLGGFFAGRRSVSGWLAELLTRLMDIIQSFPVFIVALVLVGVAGGGTQNVIIILAVLFTPIFFRYVRGQVLSERERLFIEAGVAIGNSRWRLLALYVLPNSFTPALVQASPMMGFAILLTAGLSFVGAGVRPPTPEWGAMIAAGAEQMVTGQWWASVFPGLAIGLTVFALAIVGEALRVRLEE